MSQKNDNDEASFEGLMSFSTAPPPPGDVHNARTVMAELPDDVLESLKAGNKIDPLSLVGADASPNSDALMTRRARPFELERAVAAAAERNGAALPPTTAPAPIATEMAAALSFALDPPAFPAAVAGDTAVLAPAAVGEAPQRADEPAFDSVPPAAPRRSRRVLVAALIVALCVIAAVATKLLFPILRHRLPLG